MDKSNDPSVCPYCHQKIKSFKEEGGHHCAENKMTTEEAIVRGWIMTDSVRRKGLVTGDKSKSDFNAEDEETLHNIVDEVMRWGNPPGTTGRWEKTTVNDVRNYVDTADCVHGFADISKCDICDDRIGVFDKENDSVKNAFIVNCADSVIEEMIERIVIEEMGKQDGTGRSAQETGGDV